jgi:general secretion pathway protein F
MGVRAKVLEGHPLAEGLGDFPSSFPEIYRATVAAGEQSGHLDTVLERLADYTESREQLRSRTINALLYPVMLFLVCSGIVMLMLTTYYLRSSSSSTTPGCSAADDAHSHRLLELHA